MPSETANIRHRHSLNADRSQRFPDFIELERLDNGTDQFHLVPLVDTEKPSNPDKDPNHLPLPCKTISVSLIKHRPCQLFPSGNTPLADHRQAETPRKPAKQRQESLIANKTHRKSANSTTIRRTPLPCKVPRRFTFAHHSFQRDHTSSRTDNANCIKKASSARKKLTILTHPEICCYNFSPVGLLAQLVELRTLNP